MAKVKTDTAEPLEKQLWKAADKLRKNIDAAEYKHIVQGLIFLKYISDSFEEHFARLQAGQGEYAGADPEDKDEYQAENIFFVPQEARWSFLQSHARQPRIGTFVDAAMDALEKENPSLKGVLAKVFARQNLDPTSLGGLIDLGQRNGLMIAIDTNVLVRVLINDSNASLQCEQARNLINTYNCSGRNRLGFRKRLST